MGPAHAPIDRPVGQMFARLKRALVGEPNAVEETRRLLGDAHKARVKLWLEPLMTSVRNSTLMTATIEQVRTEDIIIGQPSIGGVIRTLVSGESLRLSFSVGPAGHLNGETEVLGRFQIPSGGSDPLHGYRLAMPQGLQLQERRSAKRSDSKLNLAREVELYRSETEEPIRGVVQNLSVSGMQIRTHDYQPKLQQGDRVRLVFHLPSPVGGVNRMVSIARLAKNRNPRQQILGVSFEREIPGLAELLGHAGGRFDAA